MKHLFVFILVGAAALSIQAQQQGAVTFGNNAGAPIYNSFFGTNVHATVALYGSTFTNVTDDSLMTQVGATANTFAPGLFAGGTRNIGNPGDLVRLQIRAWTGGYATYEQALAAALGGSPGLQLNRSFVWIQPVGGSTLPTQPITGSGRFTGLDLVPEPSSVSLGVLGAGVLAFFFRRGST
jgi:hypothetical protein